MARWTPDRRATGLPRVGQTGPMNPRPPVAVTIRPMMAVDWSVVRTIYAAGIAAGNATFETEPPGWESFDAARLPGHRFVATTPGERIVGWVAASPVSRRPVYAGVVEHSVYVDPDHAGAGVGRALLLALISSTETAGIWTIESLVFPENAASLAVHRRVGFREVGVREQHGRWRDVVLIERRSPAL